MCGIAGLLTLDGAPVGPAVHPALRAMGDQIAHRGPDDEQLYSDGPLGLLFRRLSIVDLDGGRQPLINEDGSLVLVVNGEIYNYRELSASLRGRHQFRSDSDSEVILHLYEEHGLGFLDHLNGMYALALWDRRAQRLVLARDRLGVKPLYYSLTADRLIFGSEIKALLAWPDCPRALDWATALPGGNRVLRGGASSHFKGIEPLPGGHLLIADARRGTTTLRAYWRPPTPSADEFAADTRSEADLVAGYRELLADAVRLNLQADVEVGLFLSGGIDSVSVAALAARDRPLHTFTVLGQSTLTNGDAAAAHRAARHYGLPNHQVLFHWHAGACSPDAWKRLLWLCETPLCEAEMLYKFQLHRHARSVRPGLKVMLTGQGSDEYNGGYGRTWLRHLPPALHGWDRFQHALRVFERGALVPPEIRELEVRLGHRVVRDEFLAELAGRPLAADPWRFNAAQVTAMLQQFNLWHEDRTAAGNSVENRVPFLDHRLVEYCLRVPPARHAALFWDKRILRDAMIGRVPDDLRERVKVPFFDGDDVRYTRRMLHDILVADDRALLREARGDGAHPVIDWDALDNVFAEIPHDPEYAALEAALVLVNAALLERMAHDLPAPPAATTAEALASRPIADWDAELPQIALQLARRSAAVDLDHVLAFADNAYLVREDNRHIAAPRSFLVVDQRIQYYLEEAESGPWLRVLRSVDGAQTLREILTATDIDEADIRKHLEEALEYRIVTLQPPARVSAD